VTKANPENCKNCSSKYAYHCAQLSYTTQHGAILIIFPLNLQTNITAQILSIGWVHCTVRCHAAPPIRSRPWELLFLRPCGGAEYCEERVCLSVCLLSVCISPEPHDRSSPNVCGRARSSSVSRRQHRSGAESDVYDCLARIINKRSK